MSRQQRQPPRPYVLYYRTLELDGMGAYAGRKALRFGPDLDETIQQSHFATEQEAVDAWVEWMYECGESLIEVTDRFQGFGRVFQVDDGLDTQVYYTVLVLTHKERPDA